jgi:hypothetical protein
MKLINSIQLFVNLFIQYNLQTILFFCQQKLSLRLENLHPQEMRPQWELS